MKKFEFSSDLSFRYLVQSPSGKHQAFRIIKKRPGSKSKTVSVKDLTLVNKALKLGTLTKEQARKEVDLLVEQLYALEGVKKFKTVSNSDNQRLLDRFWDEVYSPRRLVDRDSAYAKYRRSVEAIGELSLMVATSRDMQKAVDAKFKGNKQRYIVNRLNTVLTWLKRTESLLTLDGEEENEVRYLKWDELEKIMLHIDIPVFRLACKVAWGTGARIGELLAMKTEHVSPNEKTVFIRHQVRRDKSKALAKGKKADSPGRKATVLPQVRGLLASWIETKHEFTTEMRLSAANIIKKASKAAYPNSSDKWVKFHDLRHSYAIELCQVGVSLLLIAQQLGNTERVCQRHYTGYMSTNESFDLIEAKLIEAARFKKIA